uniref:RRM domain-containing protein n=1 Tax=Zea mays TaxID=4577 RepID=A0A804MJE2_MAIZE
MRIVLKMSRMMTVMMNLQTRLLVNPWVPLLKMKPAAPLKKTFVAVAQKKKGDSSESDSDDDSDEEVPPKSKAPAATSKRKILVKDASKTQPAKRAASKMKDEPSDDSDTNDEEEPPQKKQKEALSATKKESSSEDEDDSSEESSDDEPTKFEEKKAPKVSKTLDLRMDLLKTRVIKTVKSLLILQRRLQCTPLKSKPLPKKYAHPKTPTGFQSESTEVNTLFMGNVLWNTEFDDVKEFFEDVGEVVDVRFPTHDDGNRKGFCYVEFVSAEAAAEFVSAEAAAKAYKEKQSKELHGREVRHDFAKGRSTQNPRNGNDGSFQKAARGNKNSIFIRGFDKNLSEDEIQSSLEQHFSDCGEMTRVSIPTDHESGAIKG